MKKKILLSLVITIMIFAAGQAKALFPDSDSAANEIELGVEGIARLCPTGMWDHWTFRDIEYDKESNTVVFVIQLNSWEDDKEAAIPNEEQQRKLTAFIIENILKGYSELKQSPHIKCDGDFMLYLSLGTLINQIEKDGANLSVVLLKPDYANLAIPDTPLLLSPSEVRSLLQ